MTKRIYNNVNVVGLRGPSGQEFYSFRWGGEQWCVSRQSMTRDSAGAFAALAEQGMPAHGAGLIADIRERIQEITTFRDADVAENVGHNGGIFARSDGTLVIPKAARSKKAAPTYVGFRRHPQRYARKGTHKRWLRDVAEPIAGSDLAIFVMAVALTPVVAGLLSTPVPPFGVQIVPDGQCAALTRLLLSVTGSMGTESLHADPIAELLADPRRLIKASRDHLLPIDGLDTHIAGAADKKRGMLARSLFFDHLLVGSGGEANAQGELAPFFLMINSMPLHELLDLEPAAIERLNEGLVTLNAPGFVRGFALDPDDLPTIENRDWWMSTRDPAQKNYGSAFDKFVRQLNKQRAEDLAGLKQKLDGWFKRFEKKALKEARKAGGDVSHARRFALIFATLRLAFQFGVLPKSRSQAMGELYRLALGSTPQPPSAAALVAEIASQSGVLSLDEIAEMSVDELQAVTAFIKSYAGGRRELWITNEQRKRLIEWRTFSKLPDFDEVYIRKGEKDRPGAKRAIGQWKGARVTRFRLS